MKEMTFWRFMRPVMWGPGLLVVIGLLFYGIAAGVQATENALRADPVRTAAEVLQAEHSPPDRPNGQPRYELTLRVPEPGGAFQDRRMVSQGIYQHARGAETVEIWQQRGNPRNYQFVVAWDPARAGFDLRLVGAGPLVVAVLILALLIWGRLPAWRAVSGGDTYEATVVRHRAVGRRRGMNTIDWTGRDGRTHSWTRSGRGPVPPVGATIPVAIDPETQREFRSDAV